MPKNHPAPKSRLKDWFQHWDSGREVSESRLKADRTRFQRYVAEALGDHPVESITSVQIEEHLATLEAKGIGPFTVDSVLGILRGVLQTAVNEGVLTANPAAGLAVDAAPALRRISIDETLSRAETRLIEKNIDLNYAAVVHLASVYGLARGEILGIEDVDVDLHGRTLAVGRSVLMERAGKTWLQPGKPRSLHVTEETNAVLGLHLTVSEQRRTLARGRLDAAPIFVNDRGGHPFLQNLHAYYLRPALEASGLSIGITLQSLRYSGIRLLIEQGASVDDVARISGYASDASVRFAFDGFFQG